MSLKSPLPRNEMGDIILGCCNSHWYRSSSIQRAGRTVLITVQVNVQIFLNLYRQELATPDVEGRQAYHR